MWCRGDRPYIALSLQILSSRGVASPLLCRTSESRSKTYVEGVAGRGWKDCIHDHPISHPDNIYSIATRTHIEASSSSSWSMKKPVSALGVITRESSGLKMEPRDLT